MNASERARAVWSALARACRPVGVFLATSFTRWEAVALVLAAVTFFTVHALLLVPAFGEDDQARFAFDAIGWHFSGKVTFEATDYRMRTSPLYIHAMKKLLDFGFPVERLSSVMNKANVVAGGTVLFGLYLLFRRIAGRSAAGIACVLLALTPAGWLGASYGMAHVPGLAFWVLSLCLFSQGLDGPPKRFWVAVLFSTVCSFLAVATKADLVLTGFAFLLLVWVKRRFTVRHALCACAIVLLGLALQILYVKSLMTAEPVAQYLTGESRDSLAGWAARWNKRFPFETKGLTEPAEVRAITNSCGPFLFSLTVLGLAHQFTRRDGFRVALWALLWSLPPVVFWGLIAGNSARHNLAALPPAMLMVALAVVKLGDTPIRTALLAAAVVLANYHSDTRGAPAGHGTMVPKTDVLTLAADVNKKSLEHRRAAQQMAKRRDPKKAVIERHFLAYQQFEQAAYGQRIGVITYDGKDLRIIDRAGKTQTVRFQYASDPRGARHLARKLKEEGFAVYSREHRL